MHRNFKAPATREQTVALIAAYNHLAMDEDPRVCHPKTGEAFGVDREARIDWARHYLGAPKLESFNDLTLLQAQYLLDLLNKGQTKLDAELARQWDRLKVRDAEGYFQAMQDKRLYWRFRGLTLRQLNRRQLWDLVQVLKARTA